MYLANLSLLQFLGLFAGIGGGVFLLYLLDRSHRRQVVASLRFWQAAMTPVESRRWRVREPLSLLLQLLGILLLLLAVAQLRFGSGRATSRDHIVILDTSAWMAARSGDGSLMDDARSRALGYVAALPANDRIMVIRAGAMVTPVTSFETDRGIVDEAIRASEPGAGAADLTEAIQVADRVRRLHSNRAGEIVYIGTGRHSAVSGGIESPPPSNLRYLRVEANIANVGLRHVGLHHPLSGDGIWEVYVVVRNYDPQPRTVDIGVQFASAPAAYRTLELEAGGEADFTFPLRTRAAGDLEVQLFADDDFPEDDYVKLEIPARRPIRVLVYSSNPERLRPLIDASPMVVADYRSPGDPAPEETDIVILDRCAPPSVPPVHSIWIEPPEGASPVRIGGRATELEIESWLTDHPIGSGLRTADIVIDRATFFEIESGDAAIASGAEGPVMVAREGGPDGLAKTVVLGFDPATPEMKYRLAAPLLFANVIRWLEPEIFRQWELNSGAVGAISVELGAAASQPVSVTGEDGEALPFSVEGSTVHFYAGTPGTVRVSAADREAVYSLHLPAIPETLWEPPGNVLRGIPETAAIGRADQDWWPWLALAGCLVLLAEWMRFGRVRTGGPPTWLYSGKRGQAS